MPAIASRCRLSERRSKALAALLLVSIMVFPAVNAQDIDPESGLVIAPGWEVVRANCTVCHSARFIILQRGDRATWMAMIRWMQKTQGLWQFDGETEDTILSYLEGNYPPGKASRRKNLSARDLPAPAKPANPIKE
ncbi:MAG: cytochrome c5 [Halieaceae bacterium]|jgi:cytochrome c5